MLNNKLTQTILHLEFTPQEMVATKHAKGLGVAQFFQQSYDTIQKYKIICANIIELMSIN